MIRKKTVFILGAGASMPYGFLSGPQLRDRLVYHAEQSRSELAMNLHRFLSVDPGQVQTFLKTFQRSGIVSIDTFLALRQQFSELGKLAIAYELCGREHENSIFRRDNDDHWYELLWNKLVADVDKPPQIMDNNVKFVSFNYDRSLEFFLYESTRHTFGLSDDDAMKFSGNLPILHVYGMLGSFRNQPTADSRQYANSLDGGQLTVAAKGIKVIPETRDDDKDFQIARNWMSNAEQIIFLGFGFDPLNVRRLGLKDVLESSIKAGIGIPAIFTTTLGLTQAEINSAMAMVCPQGWQVASMQSRMALRNWGVLN